MLTKGHCIEARCSDQWCKRIRALNAALGCGPHVLTIYRDEHNTVVESHTLKQTFIWDDGQQQWLNMEDYKFVTPTQRLPQH